MTPDPSVAKAYVKAAEPKDIAEVAQALRKEDIAEAEACGLDAGKALYESARMSDYVMAIMEAACAALEAADALALLQALGGCCAVHVYALNPCREYWFDCVEPRRLAYLSARGAKAHHEVGNALLAAWGRQAQASLTLLVDACGESSIDDAQFDEDEAAPTGAVAPSAGDTLTPAAMSSGGSSRTTTST